jgi:hypothetical protein
MRNAYKFLFGKHKQKRQLRRHRHRWKDNSKMDFRERERAWEGVNWIGVTSDMDQWQAHVNMVMNHQIP